MCIELPLLEVSICARPAAVNAIHRQFPQFDSDRRAMAVSAPTAFGLGVLNRRPKSFWAAMRRFAGAFRISV